MISGEDARNKGFTKRFMEKSRKKKHKQKTKVQTHSWDEKNSQTMIDGRKKGENVKTKDLQRDIWRHLEKKNNKNKGLR